MLRQLAGKRGLRALLQPLLATSYLLAEKYGALPLEPVEAPRAGRDHDVNPYIKFNPELCILCARCTRYCDEVEAVNAITLANRGSETTISTVAARGLLDTSCELCGGCIDTCPNKVLKLHCFGPRRGKGE